MIRYGRLEILLNLLKEGKGLNKIFLKDFFICPGWCDSVD